ncbi:MAG: tandem-95 repeat protein, partial [Planctomycetota bacterium]
GDGGFVYEPPANFSGSLTFRYRVTDGQAESEPVTVTLTIAEVNDPPVAVGDALTVLEDSVLNQVRVLANDHSGPDAPETLRVVRAGPAQHGSVGVLPDGRLVVYTPEPDFNGTDSFPYVVSDGRGGLAEGQVQVEVLPVDDPPVFDPAGPFEVDEGSTLSFSVLARDVDGDTLEYEALELPDGASFDPATRTVRWRPDYEQAGTYVLRLRACDGGERIELGSEQLSIAVGGGAGGDEVAGGGPELPTDVVLCDELEVTVIVHDVNRPPSIVEAASAGVATNLPPLVQGAVLRVHEEEVLEAELFGIDPDGDPVQLAALQLPEGARFDPERRVLTWRPRFGDRGSYVVGLAATDGQQSDFANVRIEVLPSQRLRGGAAGCSFGGGARGPASASWALVLGALAVWFGLRRRLGRRCAG